MERSSVPEGVAVGSLSVLPGVAPVCGGARDDDRRPSQRRLAAGGLDERASVVTDTQAPKGEVVHPEVVDARWKIRDVTAGEIEVDVVESARVRCRPEVDAAAGRAPDLRDPGRVVEDAGERPETRHLLGGLDLSRDRRRDGMERRDGSGLELARERDRLEIAVELEGDRLVVPVEVVRARAQPLLRVLRPLVIACGRPQRSHSPRGHCIVGTARQPPTDRFGGRMKAIVATGGLFVDLLANVEVTRRDRYREQYSDPTKSRLRGAD